MHRVRVGVYLQHASGLASSSDCVRARRRRRRVPLRRPQRARLVADARLARLHRRRAVEVAVEVHDGEVERVVHADDAPAPRGAARELDAKRILRARERRDVRGGEHARDAAVAHDDAGARARGVGRVRANARGGGARDVDGRGHVRTRAGCLTVYPYESRRSFATVDDARDGRRRRRAARDEREREVERERERIIERVRARATREARDARRARLERARRCG